MQYGSCYRDILLLTGQPYMVFYIFSNLEYCKIDNAQFQSFSEQDIYLYLLTKCVLKIVLLSDQN